MAKGYWVCTGTIHTPGHGSVHQCFQQLAEAVGARLLVRDLFSDVREGEPGTVNVIVEFESKEVAVRPTNSEYQKLIELRTPHSDMSVTITEELTD